jgi:spectrin beta
MEQAETQIKMHESFITSMDANEEKMSSVLQFADRLTEEEDHYAGDKIKSKADNIKERYLDIINLD